MSWKSYDHFIMSLQPIYSEAVDESIMTDCPFDKSTCYYNIDLCLFEDNLKYLIIPIWNPLWCHKLFIFTISFNNLKFVCIITGYNMAKVCLYVILALG